MATGLPGRSGLFAFAAVLGLCAVTSGSALGQAVMLGSFARRDVQDVARYLFETVDLLASATIAELDEAEAELAEGRIGTGEFAEELTDTAVDVPIDLDDVDGEIAEDLAEIAEEEAQEQDIAVGSAAAAVDAYYQQLVASGAASVHPALLALLQRLEEARALAEGVDPGAEAAVDAALAAIRARPVAPAGG